VIFEFDPDEENVFAPDLITVVKYTGSERLSQYRLMRLIYMDGGGSGGGGGPRSTRRMLRLLKDCIGMRG